MSNFSIDISLQLKKYQEEIELLYTALHEAKQLQNLLLAEKITISNNNGTVLSYDGVCYFVVLDKEGSCLYKGSVLDDALVVLNTKDSYDKQ